MEIQVVPNRDPLNDRTVTVAFTFEDTFEASDFMAGLSAYRRLRPACDVCEALGLGSAERANAHPHRLGDVLGVLDQTT